MSQMRILIAYDASEPSSAIFVDLHRAGLPENADVLVMSFADVLQPEPAPVTQSHEADDPDAEAGIEAESLPEYREAQLHANEAGARIRRMFPGWSVDTIAHVDAPVPGILEKAKEWEPDLIIVGSHGRSRIGRLIHGSVSQSVLCEAACSVHVARRIAVPAIGGVRIVLGSDGSVESLAAARSIASRSWPAGSAVCVVSAYGLYTVTDDLYTSPYEQPPALLSENLTVATIQYTADQIVAELAASGLAATSIIRKGQPASVVLQMAESWGADSIFLGARGHRLLDRILIGSVSSAIATGASCSVEVTRVALP